MSAPVRLEAEFFDDPSVDALATILGYADRDTAAGKLARLFSWQTEKFTAERPTYAVPRSTLVGIFGSRGPEAMVESGLATLQDDGSYKIHGSDKPNGRTPGKTRVNWLWLERQAQSERGRKRAASAGDGARNRGRFASAAPAGDQPETSRRPAGDQPATSSPISDLLSLSDLSLSGVRDGRDGGAMADDQEPARHGDRPDCATRAVRPPSLESLVTHAIARLNEARAAVDPTAQPIGPVQGQPANDLLDHLRPLAPDRRLAELNHRIDVMVATLGAEGKPVGEYRLAMLAGPKVWSKWEAGTVQSAAARPQPRPGHGPRDSPPRPLRGAAAARAIAERLEASENHSKDHR